MTEKTTADDNRVAELESTIKKLEANNAELLKQKQNAARDRDEAAARAAEAEEEKARGANDLAALEASLTRKFQKTIDGLTAERDGANKQLHTLLVENGITTALTEANVAPQYMSAAAALIKTSNNIDIADGAATIGGAPLAEFVAGWAKGDAGRHFVAAPVNGGGGSTGSTSTSGATGRTKENWNLTEYAKLRETNATAAAQWADAAGHGYLNE